MKNYLIYGNNILLIFIEAFNLLIHSLSYISNNSVFKGVQTIMTKKQSDRGLSILSG